MVPLRGCGEADREEELYNQEDLQKKFLIALCSIILLTAANKNCDDIECHKNNIEEYKKELNKSFQELVKSG